MKIPAKLTTALSLILMHTSPMIAAEQSPRVYDAAALETENGVLFRCRVPDAEKVYLAGDFNNWADNDGGRIDDDRFLMQGPDRDGVFSKTVQLLPGIHAYKFCIDGEPGGWFVPVHHQHYDEGGNALVMVDGKPDMSPTARKARLPVISGNTVTFEIQTNEAPIVFLAGSFNNWADNDEGLVTDHRFAMEGPDVFGIWRKTVKLPSGTHHYQFVLDGRTWIPDPLDPSPTADKHSIVVVP